MTSNRFFVTKASVREGRVELEGREHHHLNRVARVMRAVTAALCAASAMILMWGR